MVSTNLITGISHTSLPRAQFRSWRNLFKFKKGIQFFLAHDALWAALLYTRRLLLHLCLWKKKKKTCRPQQSSFSIKD